METIIELYRDVHLRFPSAAAKADILFANDWGEFLPEYSYSWFEKLAYALNVEMKNGIAFSEHKQLFDFLDAVLQDSSDEVKNCLDVAFTENLFWQLAKDKAAPYWSGLPVSIKSFYLAFHGKPPS